MSWEQPEQGPGQKRLQNLPPGGGQGDAAVAVETAQFPGQRPPAGSQKQFGQVTLWNAGRGMLTAMTVEHDPGVVRLRRPQQLGVEKMLERIGAQGSALNQAAQVVEGPASGRRDIAHVEVGAVLEQIDVFALIRDLSLGGRHRHG
jgi:hypothetical protein